MRNPPTRSETDFSELTESELPGWLPRCDDPVAMDRLITIGTYTTRGEAEIVEGLLESAGIAASIRADDAGGAIPFEFSGRAQVLVDESDAEAAAQLLAEQTDKD